MARYVIKHDLVRINVVIVYLTKTDDNTDMLLFSLSSNQYLSLSRTVDGCLKLYDLIGCRTPLSKKALKEILLDTDFSKVSTAASNTNADPCKCIKCGYDNPYNTTVPYICSGCKLWKSIA